MPLACLLAAFGLGVPNPLSFGGSAGRFDPARPGIAGLVRHPLLWVFALWAASHAVPNGDLAHLLLFGTFTAMALLGMVAIDRRKRRQMGEAEWARLAARTAFWPFANVDLRTLAPCRLASRPGAARGGGPALACAADAACTGDRPFAAADVTQRRGVSPRCSRQCGSAGMDASPSSSLAPFAACPLRSAAATRRRPASAVRTRLASPVSACTA